MPARVRAPWRLFRYRLRRHCSGRPALFFTLYRLHPRDRTLMVGRGTDIVIEGYPRSANTFAVLAFLSANPAARVAHHLHAQAQVIRAAALGIPSLVLVRQPMEAVRSLLLRKPYASSTLALSYWCEFHQDILGLSRLP